MGIPFYFRVITREFPDILSAKLPKCFLDMYVDFNGMIHQAARKVEPGTTDMELAICEETWKYLQSCVGMVKPTNKVHICIDGVAPVAKMAQQRKRRYLSLKRCELEKTTTRWDTNAITPGTQFMEQFKVHLQAKITPRYTLSAADEPGEGEHKIFAMIAAESGTEPVCIYGLDADLIMLSLMSHRKQIFLMRETEAPGEFTYLDVDKLRNAILHQITQKHKWNVPNSSDAFDTGANDMVESYLVLCFLLGNDFLPHIPSLSLKKDGHQKLLRAAALCPEICVQNGVIKMSVILDILREVQQHENAVLLELNDEYMKNMYYNKQDVDSYPLANKDAQLAIAIALAGNKWRQVYYKSCFSSKINDTKVVVSACSLYLKGLLWTYAYYKRKSYDYKWYYPYGYAPSVLDLANTLSACDELEAMSGKWEPARFVHPDVQLLTVLPPMSMPERLRKYTTDPALGLAHLYPSDYPIKTYLCDKLWQCVPVLPTIDIDLIERSI